MQIGIVIGTALATLAVAAAPASAQVNPTARDSTNVSSRATTRATQMHITRAGSQPSSKGPADWFTGTVRIDPLFTAPAPARATGATVTFEPGARTAWHRHPLGQTLIVLSGAGRVQREGSEIEEIRPGDVVWIPANARHWHGASPTTAMTHIAIHEALDGKVVDWFEHVTDDQYSARPRAR
jgi:quercetin dioxygenase-like cupin family protein